MPRYRAIASVGPDRPTGALALAGGWAWFDRVEISGDGPERVAAASDLPLAARARLTAPRASLVGLSLERPRIMGILNVTPDSFSDGGRHAGAEAAAAGAAMVAAGADLLDVGGESTRPGAAEVPPEEEIARVVPVIRALRARGVVAPVSIDTRKAAVAAAALDAGADMVNDVSALGHDPAMAGLVAARGVALCLMHARGTPETMQRDPHYANVLAEVFETLAARIALAEAEGIARARILVDPGIGFGKTAAHNLALLRGLSLFHDLGCALLLGVSRKSFIGTISGEPEATRRAPGSIALGLEALRQGAQVLRVHDVAETAQAVALWRAVNAPG
ncbi:MAG: dihydropteroate synthase [Alphaproteobacteria bacterium HGW-Alphaproteobacteria-2]|nr:MAG: dihydropteroate synthase [Alphaproteobacteria bacterium HGW-Alphaproteobacteria-2]